MFRGLGRALCGEPRELAILEFAFVAALYLIPLLFAPVIPVTISEPSQYPHSQSTEEHRTAFKSVWVIASTGIGGFIDRNPEDIVAVFTVILTISTIALWTATKETAKISERTLTELERPWVHITNVDVNGILEDPPILRIEKVNYGKVTGRVKGIRAGFKVSANEIDPSTIPLMEKPLEDVRNTIPLDKPYTSIVRFMKYESAFIPMAIDAGDAKVVFRVVLLYEGLTGVQFETEACLRYDATSRGLVRFGGHQYNYTT